jgi:hypothetical protein
MLDLFDYVVVLGWTPVEMWLVCFCEKKEEKKSYNFKAGITK